MLLKRSNRVHVARYYCEMDGGVDMGLSVALIQDIQKGKEFMTFEAPDDILFVRQGKERQDIILLSETGGVHCNQDDDGRIEFFSEDTAVYEPDVIVVRDTYTGREFLVYSTCGEDSDEEGKLYADVMEL